MQTYIGPHWGYVTPFALPESPTGTPIDPGPPPLLGDSATDAEFKQAALDVLRYSSLLDPAESVEIDISPASAGDNTLGTNDGGAPVIADHPLQPARPGLPGHALDLSLLQPGL